jgi:hypothetical protein
MAKKNIRTIPTSVRSRLEKLPDRYLVAAVLKVFTGAELESGALAHLGVTLSAEGLQIPGWPVVPLKEMGKYSDWNFSGREVVRKDLPKETLHNAVESPNWGDSYNGTHTVYLPYERYPRDFIAPELASILIEAADQNPGREQYGLTFKVDTVLDRQSPSFEDDLLRVLNLLQENVGACGVQPSGVRFEDYLETRSLAWEILPPGTREEVVGRILGGRASSPEVQRRVEKRYDFLMSLKPARLISGTSGFVRYFGGQLADDLVVFENIEYGNAAYIMFGNWEELSQKSRTELLSGRFGDNFERVIHDSGWEKRVKRAVAERLSSGTPGGHNRRRGLHSAPRR